MEKQYSVEFFTSFVDSVQKLCRHYLNFEQAVELSGYLCLEIDNTKKERYVLSELVQSSGDVISESYCTKAFKTVRKSTTTAEEYRGSENITPRDRLRSQKEPSSNVSYQQHNAGQSSGSNREARVGRSEKSHDVSSPFRSSGSTSRNVLSVTNITASGMHNVVESEARSLKRGAQFAEDPPASKKDRTGSTSSGADETPVSPEERIRLPLAVTIKQEHDVPVMVIDNPDPDLSDDQYRDGSGHGRADGHSGGHSGGFTADRGSGVGDSHQVSVRASFEKQEKEHESLIRDPPRNETFTNIQRMLNVQQENLMRIHNAPSTSFMRTMSPMNRTYTCDKCDYVSKWKSNLTRHMRLKHGEMRDDQNVGYPYSQVLYPHNMYPSPSVPNVVPTGNPSAEISGPNAMSMLKSSATGADEKQNLNDSAAQLHGQTTLAANVEAILKSSMRLAEESQKSNEQKLMVKCDQEEEASPKYRCQIPDCGQTFRKTRHLQVHMNGHYRIKPYKCDKCGSAFESHSDWKKHLTTCEASSSSQDTSISSNDKFETDHGDTAENANSD